MAIITAHAVTGQITVTTAGTAVQGPDVLTPGGVFIKALAANTGKMYYGNNDNGDVDSSTGFELSAGEKIYVGIGNLKDLWFDSSVNGEKVCWSKA